MIFSDIKAQQLGYIITAKQFRGAPKLGYSWYQKAKASDQPLHFFAFFGAAAAGAGAEAAAGSLGPWANLSSLLAIFLSRLALLLARLASN